MTVAGRPTYFQKINEKFTFLSSGCIFAVFLMQILCYNQAFISPRMFEMNEEEKGPRPKFGLTHVTQAMMPA
jgi:hypothetical protein